AARHLGEGTVTITPTTITMKGLDKAHVVYIETVIYSTFFTEYQADEEERIGLDYEELSTIIKSITSADEATLTSSESIDIKVDEDYLHLKTCNDYNHFQVIFRHVHGERVDGEYLSRFTIEKLKPLILPRFET